MRTGFFIILTMEDRSFLTMEDGNFLTMENRNFLTMEEKNFLPTEGRGFLTVSREETKLIDLLGVILKRYTKSHVTSVVFELLKQRDFGSI